MFIKACNCYWTLFPKFFNTPPCLNSTQLDCLNIVASSYNTDQANFVQRYINRCPLECETVKYGFQSSSLYYPSYEAYIQLTTETVPYAPNFNFTLGYTQPYYYYFLQQYNIDVSTYDLYRDYFYSMKIFYSKATFTQITESPQQGIIDLLSSLGGNLGMFLGFSIFSLVEVFELLIKVIWVLVFFKSKKN